MQEVANQCLLGAVVIHAIWCIHRRRNPPYRALPATARSDPWATSVYMCPIPSVGPHDLGGDSALQQVPLDMSERSYEFWERNIHGLMVLLVTKGALTVDEMRRAIEYLPPAVYATWGYYEKWAVGISHILIERGIFAQSAWDEALGCMMGVQVMHVEYSTSTAAVGSDKIPRATATGDKTTTATESNSISTVPPIPTPVVCDKIPRATAIGDKTTTATESNSISTAPPIPTPVPTHTHTHTPNTHTLTHTAHAGGRNANDDSGAAALFEPGARVRVRLSTSQPLVRRPHLRTPGYIHGCAGVVERYLGMFHDPSFLAWRGYKQQQHLYRVRFIRKDIWVGTGVLPESRAGQGAAGRGDGGDLLDSVDVEIYESWLEPALAPAAGTGTDTDTDTGTGTGTADTGTRVGRDSGGSSTLTHDHEHSHSSHAPATAATVATVATAATVHDHSHAHTHDHGGEHIHEDRSTVEQNALDKEQEDTLGKYIAEVLIEQCIKRQVVTPLELTQALEKVDMLGSKSEGPRIVARAWSDPEFKKRLLIDANMALAELGIAGSNNTASTKLVVLENTRDTHNVIVCTLCSCYPLSILGLSPPWYKSRAYRARLVRAPRSVLAEFGTVLKAHVKVNVHDSTADCRYIVLPVRPERTAGWTEEQLQAIVTRDSMIGVRELPP